MKQFNLEEYLKNPKRVVTRDGRSVKIHCTNYVNAYPVIAEIEGSGESHSYTKDGTLLFDVDSSDDLFFATERKEGWANLYNRGNIDYIGCVYTSKEEAEENKGKGNKESYVATVEIEWEE